MFLFDVFFLKGSMLLFRGRTSSCCCHLSSFNCFWCMSQNWFPAQGSKGWAEPTKRQFSTKIGSHVNIWSLGWHIIETLHPQVFMRIMALDVNLPTNPIRRDDPRFYIKNGSFFRIRIASTCHHLFPTILVRELENIVHPNHHPKHGPYLR